MCPLHRVQEVAWKPSELFYHPSEYLLLMQKTPRLWRFFEGLLDMFVWRWWCMFFQFLVVRLGKRISVNKVFYTVSLINLLWRTLRITILRNSFFHMIPSYIRLKRPYCCGRNQSLPVIEFWQSLLEHFSRTTYLLGFSTFRTGSSE